MNDATPARAHGDRPTAATGDRRTGVLVVGTHRSGTSAMTRMLSHLGCALPATLLPGSPGNPTGHWESEPVTQLNDRLLAAFDLAWFDWASLPADWPAGAVWHAFAPCARATLGAEFGEAPLFVLKDPRLCRLLPGWRAVLADAGVAARVVVPVRHPTEVARSLEVRSGIDRSAGYLLWLRDSLEAERQTRDMPRVFLGYDDLLADWRRAAADAAQALDVRWPTDPESVADDIDAFIAPARCHHDADAQPPSADPAGFGWVDRVYDALRPACGPSGRRPDPAALDAVRAELDSAESVFARPVQSGQRGLIEAHELRQRVAELTRHCGSLSEQLDNVYASTSWRVTRPLRTGTTVTRRLVRTAAALLTGRGD